MQGRGLNFKLKNLKNRVDMAEDVDEDGDLDGNLDVVARKIRGRCAKL